MFISIGSPLVFYLTGAEGRTEQGQGSPILKSDEQIVFGRVIKKIKGTVNINNGKKHGVVYLDI